MNFLSISGIVCVLAEVFFDRMNGGELFERIAKKGPLSEALAKRYAKATLEALEYLHGLGIVHRDIKALYFPFLSSWHRFSRKVTKLISFLLNSPRI